MKNPMPTLIGTPQPNPDFADESQGNLGKAFPRLLAAGEKGLERVKVQKPVVGEQTLIVLLVTEVPDAETIEGVFS